MQALYINLDFFSFYVKGKNMQSSKIPDHSVLQIKFVEYIHNIS